MIYKWKCIKCLCTTDVERRIADSAVPPDGGLCMCEFPNWARVYEAPMVLEASYRDGVRRKGFAEQREAAKLTVAAATETKQNRKEIAAEIRKMGVKPSKTLEGK